MLKKRRKYSKIKRNRKIRKNQLIKNENRSALTWIIPKANRNLTKLQKKTNTSDQNKPTLFFDNTSHICMFTM
jgi:hypothetical protein